MPQIASSPTPAVSDSRLSLETLKLLGRRKKKWPSDELEKLFVGFSSSLEAFWTAEKAVCWPTNEIDFFFARLNETVLYVSFFYVRFLVFAPKKTCFDETLSLKIWAYGSLHASRHYGSCVESPDLFLILRLRLFSNSNARLVVLKPQHSHLYFKTMVSTLRNLFYAILNVVALRLWDDEVDSDKRSYYNPKRSCIASGRNFEKFSSEPFCMPIYPLLRGNFRHSRWKERCISKTNAEWITPIIQKTFWKPIAILTKRDSYQLSWNVDCVQSNSIIWIHLSRHLFALLLKSGDAASGTGP